MPNECEWITYFDPKKILKSIGLNKYVRDVADFGCGYGNFAIPAAKTVSGKVYAIDIDSEMINSVKDKMFKDYVNNVETSTRDILKKGSGLNDESVDYVLLFHVLHTQHPKKLLEEAFRVLRKKGCIAILNWKVDPETPGLPMDIRPSIEQCIDWCIKIGFNPTSTKVFNFKPYHYGIVMTKN